MSATRSHKSLAHPRIASLVMTATLAVLLTLASCGQKTNVTSQPPTNMPGGAFFDLHMITTKVGWMQSRNIPVGNGLAYFTILRTTDGGRHWQAVLKCSPYEGGRGFTQCLSDFHSSTIATLLEPDYTSATQAYQSRIFHTSDAGRTWQSAVINANSMQTPPTFVDALHGWFLGTDHFPGYDPGSSYIGKEIALYRTSDGGRTWQRIASGPATSQLTVTSDDAYGIAPLTASAGLRFVNATTGWLAGTSYRKDMSNYSWLYVTHDAGISWQQVRLSFPSQSIALGLPTFFNQQDGFLPVTTSGPAPQYVQKSLLYATHDGGLTWTETAVPFDISNAEWMDMQHAWLLAPDTTDNTFYITSDGWRHWTKGSIHTTFKRIYNFSFVSPTLGWAIADNRTMLFHAAGGGFRHGDIFALLQTSNGGQTWQEIASSKI